MNKYNTQQPIAALILAAGRSSRMQHGQEGTHKLLLPLGQGTILSHVIAATLASQARPIILILGHQSEQIRASLTPYLDTLPNTVHSDLIIIENPAYAQGMSTSLHKGIQTLINQQTPLPSSLDRRDVGLSPSVPAGPGRRTGINPRPYDHQIPTPDSPLPCDGALILLGDQPLVTPTLLNQLIATRHTTNKPIIAPFYNGKRKNPVLFAADLFPELLTITGDQGARSIIEKHPTEIGRLDVDDARLWYDVDTWEGYQEVLRIWK